MSLRVGDVINYHGIAARVVAEECDEPYERKVVMVGDDRRITIIEDEYELIDRDRYCGECGQMGCLHGR